MWSFANLNKTNSRTQIYGARNLWTALLGSEDFESVALLIYFYLVKQVCMTVSLRFVI